MSTKAEISYDSQTLTVQVPMTFRRRGGRKQITPDNAPILAPRSARIDSALVKALARAHRWKAVLEEGTYGSIRDLAAAERINSSFVSRVIRLTLLAPHIVEAILDGKAQDGVSLDRLMKPFPVLWQRQLGPESKDG